MRGPDSRSPGHASNSGACISCASICGSSLRSMVRSISRIRSRTGVIDARTSYCKRTAISCCVISPRTWPRNWTRCSMGFCGLRGAPHVRVGSTGQLLFANGVDVMSKSGEDRDEAVGQVFVEFDLHRLIGVSIRGMSSRGEPAANAMAARMSSSDKDGKSARISAVVAPSARLARTSPINNETFGTRCVNARFGAEGSEVQILSPRPHSTFELRTKDLLTY